jgi:hypothetical protein
MSAPMQTLLSSSVATTTPCAILKHSKATTAYCYATTVTSSTLVATCTTLLLLSLLLLLSHCCCYQSCYSCINRFGITTVTAVKSQLLLLSVLLVCITCCCYCCCCALLEEVSQPCHYLPKPGSALQPLCYPAGQLACDSALAVAFINKQDAAVVTCMPYAAPYGLIDSPHADALVILSPCTTIASRVCGVHVLYLQ